DLLELRDSYPKLAMPEAVIRAYLKPPANPAECIFARTTRTITADLKTRITPCQFGGNPDCSQCGCIASAGLAAVGRYRFTGGISVARICEGSLKIGDCLSRLRNKSDSTPWPEVEESPTQLPGNDEGLAVSVNEALTVQDFERGQKMELKIAMKNGEGVSR